jgi:putative transposase
MKDELSYSHCTTFAELQAYFDQYMHYYNNERPQWTRKKMTPVAYRNHLLEISKQKHIV